MYEDLNRPSHCGIGKFSKGFQCYQPDGSSSASSQLRRLLLRMEISSWYLMHISTMNAHIFSTLYGAISWRSTQGLSTWWIERSLRSLSMRNIEIFIFLSTSKFSPISLQFADKIIRWTSFVLGCHVACSIRTIIRRILRSHTKVKEFSPCSLQGSVPE